MYPRRFLPLAATQRTVGAPRHDMSPRLFFTLLFLLLMCCACGPAGSQQVGGQTGVDLFVPGAAQISSAGGKTFNAFTSPSLVEVDGMIIALAEAHRTEGSESVSDIVEGHAELKGDGTVGGVNAWAKQIVATKQNVTIKGHRYLKPRAIVKDNKIFVYFTNSFWDDHDHDYKKDYHFVVGDVDGKAKTITWSQPASLEDTLKKTPGHSVLLDALITGGSGVLTKNQTLVLPVIYPNPEGLFVPTIMYSVDSGNEWVLVRSTLSLDCTYPAVVEWRDKLLMMTLCSDDHYNVFESSDMGNTWTEAVGTLSRVWEKTKRGNMSPELRPELITANIDGKSVMFFAQFVKSEASNYRLHLWLTDGSRIYDVGPISALGETATSSRLLYAKENLFTMYEKGEKDKSSLHLGRLDNELKEIRRVLGVWAERDAFIANSCGTPDLKPAPAGKACATRMPTDGLVGFLSGNGDESHWRDEYLCVNATVAGGTRVAGGFKFSGPGEGAQWPVGAQGQNQRYRFANYGFTLVATVFIHSAPEGGDSPLLGVAVNNAAGNTVLFGLSCSADRKWVIKTGSGGGSLANTTWEPKRQYQVALVFQSGRGSVYVDWQPLGGKDDGFVRQSFSEKIQHFYFGAGAEGGGSAVKSHVTVTNALLYNRPFNRSEMQALRDNFATSPDLSELGNCMGRVIRKDGCVHVPLGRALLLLLGLLGLALLC